MKKKIIPILVCLVAALTLALTGCGGDSFSKIEVSGNQDYGYTVHSNGGSAVQYGNYIYFINGYSGYEDTDGKQNTWPDVIKGGLYRAELKGEKIGSEFEIAKNTEAEAAGVEFALSTEKGEDIFGNAVDIASVQLIAPKRIGTSGYSDGGIFIYDEWVYFASPNNEKDKSGVVQYNKTDFFRARLDGTASEKLYTTENDSTDAAYAFYKYDGAVYLVTKDGSNLVSVRVESKKGKIGDKVTIAQNITSAYLPYSETYYSGMNENTLDHFVYVLRAVGEGDTQKSGNVIEVMRPDGTGGGVFLSQGKSDTIEAVRDGLLFYRTADDAGNTLIKYDSLHDFLMGPADGKLTYGDAKYRAYQEKLASYVGEDGKFKDGVSAEQKAEYENNVRTQMSGGILSTSSASDYLSTYCFRPDGERSNVVYMLGIKSSGAELRSSVALTSSNPSQSVKTINVYNSGLTLLNVANEYMYFTDTDASIIYRTRWDKAVSEKSEAELKEQVSHDDAASNQFNGDYCAGYIVYTGKVDDKAEGYTFFKLVERTQNVDAMFVGKKIDADILAAPSISIDGNSITWSAVDGAQSYNVYCTTDGETALVAKGIEGTEYTVLDSRHGAYSVAAVSGTAIGAKSSTVNY